MALSPRRIARHSNRHLRLPSDNSSAAGIGAWRIIIVAHAGSRAARGSAQAPGGDTHAPHCKVASKSSAHSGSPGTFAGKRQTAKARRRRQRHAHHTALALHIDSRLTADPSVGRPLTSTKARCNAAPPRRPSVQARAETAREQVGASFDASISRCPRHRIAAQPYRRTQRLDLRRMPQLCRGTTASRHQSLCACARRWMRTVTPRSRYSRLRSPLRILKLISAAAASSKFIWRGWTWIIR